MRPAPACGFPDQGQVAQSVEQGTENPRVGGSIPSLATTTLIVPLAQDVLPVIKSAKDLIGQRMPDRA